MKKALGLEELSQPSKDYLEALAEAYGNANGWDTRRQILSIMAGLASYKAISVFIPGLSRYHYTIANLHRLQFGRGASMTYQPLVRVRVERQQLDHFLSFITSPHLVQDLPFGQNMLTLSSGKTIEIPNVIRTLIPQSVFALSDCTNSDLRQLCDHRHEEVCEQCENLNSMLASISEAVARAPFHKDDDRDEAVYLANHATLAIQSWKCHLLRSAHQDQARLDVIDALNQETVFIVNDWAMKFLPQRYRESANRLVWQAWYILDRIPYSLADRLLLFAS